MTELLYRVSREQNGARMALAATGSATNCLAAIQAFACGWRVQRACFCARPCTTTTVSPERGPGRVHDDRLGRRVLRRENDLAAAPAKPFDGDLVLDACDDDLARPRLRCLVDGEQIAVEDSRILHAGAAHA